MESEDGLEILKEKLGCLSQLKNIMYCNQMWNQKMKWRRTRSWVVARIHRSMSSRSACFRIVLKLCCNCPAMPNMIPNCPNHLQQKWKPASEVHQIWCMIGASHASYTWWRLFFSTIETSLHRCHCLCCEGILNASQSPFNLIHDCTLRM
jgi:hypothetical protein